MTAELKRLYLVSPRIHSLTHSLTCSFTNSLIHSSVEVDTYRVNKLKQLDDGRVEEVVFSQSVSDECIGDGPQ